MKSRATPRFWAAYRDLPPEIKDAARKAYQTFFASVLGFGISMGPYLGRL